MRLLAKWILVALVFLALPKLIAGISILTFTTALWAAFFWGLVSLILRPLILLIAFPITILTLGLFSFVVNALLFWVVGGLVPGFAVAGFIPALLGSLIISVATFLADKLLSEK